MSTYEIRPLPLVAIVREVKRLIDTGYNPTHYLSQFLIGDDGGRLRKL